MDRILAAPAADDVKTGIHLATAADACYVDLCEFAREQFKRRFSTRLENFYPSILGCWSDGEIQGVVGIRAAVDGPLFLEQYLEQPIEEYLGHSRDYAVEVGGFAAANRLVAFSLMRETGRYLLESGFKTVVCTANDPVRACLRRLKITHTQIGEASAAKLGQLGESQEEWGSYYESCPLVLAGDISTGVEAMQTLVGAAS